MNHLWQNDSRQSLHLSMLHSMKKKLMLFSLCRHQMIVESVQVSRGLQSTIFSRTANWAQPVTFLRSVRQVSAKTQKCWSSNSISWLVYPMSLFNSQEPLRTSWGQEFAFQMKTKIMRKRLVWFSTTSSKLWCKVVRKRRWVGALRLPSKRLRKNKGHMALLSMITRISKNTNTFKVIIAIMLTSK